MKPIFFSTMLYAQSKAIGLHRAANEFAAQTQLLAEREEYRSGRVDWPGMLCALTAVRVAQLGELTLHVNAGSTVIGKARSMAAHEFLASPCEVWFSCDDDVGVSADALEVMLGQCRRDPSVVVAPCLQRETRQVNIRGESPVLLAGGTLQKIAAGGFGCVAMSREIVELARDKARAWTEDGVTRAAIFRDAVEDGDWWTEDLAFFHRHPYVSAYAVRVGNTQHGPGRLDLATLTPFDHTGLKAPPIPFNGGRLTE
jgi:hypothetical protein